MAVTSTTGSSAPARAGAATLASTALRALLAGPPQPAEVVGHGRVAAYLRLAARRRVVAVVAPEAVLLPNAVTADAALVARVRPGPAALGGGRLQAGPITLVPSRWWDPRPSLPAVALADLSRRLDELERSLPAWPAGAGPAAGRLRAAAGELTAALRAGDAAAAAAAAPGLVGLGPGLTPAGDDVLAGTLAALTLLGEAAGADVTRLRAAVGDAVAAAEARTTALSATLLEHAGHGEVAAPAAPLLRWLAAGGALAPALRPLLVVGHTSGADLARGIAAAAGAVAAAGGRA